MILERNGTTTDIKLLDMAVAVKLPISNQDASANTSSTDTLNTGTKAKSLSVAGRIAFSSAADLTELMTLASALTDTGARAVYTIVDDTADAAAIDRVIFDGDLDARKIPDLQAWAVTFKLSEFMSIAERVEQQKKSGFTNAKTATDSATTGNTVAGTKTDTASTTADEEGGFMWQMLKKLDKFLEELEADN